MHQDFANAVNLHVNGAGGVHAGEFEGLTRPKWVRASDWFRTRLSPVTAFPAKRQAARQTGRRVFISWPGFAIKMPALALELDFEFFDAEGVPLAIRGQVRSRPGFQVDSARCSR